MKNVFKTCLFFALLTVSKVLFAQDSPQWQPTNVNVTPTSGEGYYAFYQEFNAQGNCVLLYGNNHTPALNLKNTKPSGANDRIKSVVVVGPIANSRIVVFDNPDGQTDDDYAEIVITGSLPAGQRVVIPSFNIGAAPGVFYNSNGITVTEYFHYHNGLDGKISHISRAVGQ